jgi:hypothetical protein
MRKGFGFWYITELPNFNGKCTLSHERREEVVRLKGKGKCWQHIFFVDINQLIMTI